MTNTTPNSDLQFIIENGEELIKQGDNPTTATMRFYHTVRRLILAISTINGKLPADKAVRSELIFLADSVVERMKPEDFSPIVDTFAKRACPVVDDIKNRDVDKFTSSANEIFKGAPQPMINSITSVINNGSLTEENVKSIFDIIHSLLRMSMKKKTMDFTVDGKGVSSALAEEDPELVKNLANAIRVFGLSK